MSTIKPLVYDPANARLAEQAVVIPPGYIDGLNLVWNSGTSISVTSGSAYIESLGAIVNVSDALTLSGLSLTASTWYHVYLYLNAGVPAIECVTTDPASPYSGTARSKTGDTSRRYIASVRVNPSGNIIRFVECGGTVKYEVSAFDNNILSGGVSTSPTEVDPSLFIPITCEIASIRAQNEADTYAIIGNSANSYIIPFNERSVLIMDIPASSTKKIVYKFDYAPTVGGLIISIIGYTFNR